MNEKTLSKFILHLKKYDRKGDIYFQKGYSRIYTEKEIIEHFIKKNNVY